MVVVSHCTPYCRIVLMKDAAMGVDYLCKWIIRFGYD
jgi:hypothetical protein